MQKILIAPCGMNCAVCSAYLAFKNRISKVKGKIVYCEGCRPRNKKCAYLKGHCKELDDKKVNYCFECSNYPCQRLSHINERYRLRFGVSLLSNLGDIKTLGIEKFLQNEKQKYSCSRCGESISIHNHKCYICDKIENWKS